MPQRVPILERTHRARESPSGVDGRPPRGQALFISLSVFSQLALSQARGIWRFSLAVRTAVLTYVVPYKLPRQSPSALQKC